MTVPSPTSTKIQLSPDFNAAYTDRGVAYASKGDYDRAIAIQLSSSKAIVGDFDAYYNRGKAHEARNDLTSAAADFRVAASVVLASDPKHEDALQRLASIERKVAGASSSIGPVEIKRAGSIDGGPVVIYVTGEFKEGMDRKFIEQIVGLDNVLVVFNSTGGAIDPALEIGRAIRLKGFTTVVLDGETCASACALAWVAGQRRFMAPTAKVGFHAAYELQEDIPVEKGAPNALIGGYLSSLGFSQSAIYYITISPPEGMNWLTFEQATELGIFVERWMAQLPISSKPSPSALPFLFGQPDEWQQGLTPMPSTVKSKSGEDLADTDIPYGDLGQIGGIDYAECKRQCMARPECLALTFNHICWLKGSVAEQKSFVGATSWVKP